jgi:hypothetical protein
MRKWQLLAAAMVIVIVGGVAYGLGTSSNEPAQAAAQTTEASAIPSPTVDPNVAEVIDETAEPPALPEIEEPEVEVVTGSNGDARACELLRSASTREANSPSWIDIMGDASYKATDYDLMDSIDKAYWTSGDALAAERVDDTLLICERLGV